MPGAGRDMIAGSTGFMRRRRRAAASRGWGWKSCFVVAGTLAVALIGAGGPARAQIPVAGSADVAAAFTRAWNQHDVNGLLTAIRPDVVVRQRGAGVVPRGTYVEVADILGRRSVLSDPRRLAPDGTIT